MNFLSRANTNEADVLEIAKEPPLLLSHGLMAAAYDREEVEFSFTPLAVARYLEHWWIEQEDGQWRRVTVSLVIDYYNDRRPSFRRASGNYARDKAVARAARSIREGEASM